MFAHRSEGRREGVKVSVSMGKIFFDKNQICIIAGSYTHLIPMSVRAAETTAEGKSIYLHDPKGIVAEGYRHLTGEVLADEK